MLVVVFEYKVVMLFSFYFVCIVVMLLGVKFFNVSGELCGGSLMVSFVDFCNLVFVLFGVKFGVKKFVFVVEVFGFNDMFDVFVVKVSMILKVFELKDLIVVGVSVIG